MGSHGVQLHQILAYNPNGNIHQAAGSYAPGYVVPRTRRPQAIVYWNIAPPSTSTLFHETGWTAPLHPTFHLFPQLPPELRIKIWIFSAAFPRVIELRSWGNTRSNPHAPIKYTIGPHRPPSILHINKESRHEALRIYTPIHIGVSAAIIHPDREYVDWRYHPSNPNRLRGRSYIHAQTHPLAKPFAPVKIYVDFSRDVIYLGPEFRAEHLESFLCTPAPDCELAGLQYLALDRKLWLGSTAGRWENLRTALFALKGRPVKEVLIVPDDERNALEDRWYFGKHEVAFKEPGVGYEFVPEGQSGRARTVVQNLGEWFERLWRPGDGDGESVDDEEEVKAPRVGVVSVRRSGKVMGDFKDGIWEVQKALGDMRVWKTWVPKTT